MTEDAATEGNGAGIASEVRALREDMAALRELLADRPRPKPAVRQVVATPEQERIARQLRDELIQREEELQEARKELLRAERERDEAETRRRKMLESRTWQWGVVVAKVGMWPVNTLKAVYGWLLAVLPGPANQALRRAIAAARGGRPTTVEARRFRARAGAGAGAEVPASAEALVPIPVHGPEGVGAPLVAPAVLLVTSDVDETALAGIVEELDELRRRVDGLRVLVVTDCDAFHIFRARSMLFEYVPPRREWERHAFEQPYDAFRQARLSELFRVYSPDRIVHVRSAEDLRGLPVTMFAA